MNPVLARTKPIIRDIVKPIGFKNRGPSFYRRMDGFVQGFKIYARFYNCSIRLFILPLCAEIDRLYEGCDVSLFWSKRGTEFYEMWSHAEEEVEAASRALVDAFNIYVLPWFIENDTIEKAHKAYKMLHYDFWLRAAGGDTPENREQVRKRAETTFAFDQFQWMMQMKRYDEAVRYLDIDIQDMENYEKENHMTFSFLQGYRDMRGRIDKRDMEFIEDYMRRGETVTITSLKI